MFLQEQVIAGQSNFSWAKALVAMTGLTHNGSVIPLATGSNLGSLVLRLPEGHRPAIYVYRQLANMPSSCKPFPVHSRHKTVWIWEQPCCTAALFTPDSPATKYATLLTMQKYTDQTYIQDPDRLQLPSILQLQPDSSTQGQLRTGYTDVILASCEATLYPTGISHFACGNV